MEKTTCINVPEAPNGELSKMYQDLFGTLRDRPKTNLYYAIYRSSDTAEKMEAATDDKGNKIYHKNKQGEFDANDVLDFLQYKKTLDEKGKLNEAARVYGAVNEKSERINYTDAEEALEKADRFNKDFNAFVAIVYKHGNVYNIDISEKNSFTYTYPMDTRERLAIWNVYKQFFKSAGIDIEDLPDSLKDTFNAYNVDIASTLINIKNRDFKYMYPKDVSLLFNLDPESQAVKRVVTIFGSIDQAAQAVYDINHGSGEYSPAQIRLLTNAINHCKEFKGLDLAALQKQVSGMSEQVRSESPEQNIKTTLHQLNKKYGIAINELQLLGDKISSLSQANGEAIMQLTRKIRELENEGTDLEEARRLTGVRNGLIKELSSNRHYSGILQFLQEARKVQAEIDGVLANATTTGTDMQKAAAMAKAINTVRQYRDMYYPTVKALSFDTLLIDESIGQEELDNLRRTATELKNYFDKKDQVINQLKTSAMLTILKEIIGDRTPDGQYIDTLLESAQKDSTVFDMLFYSVGRQSNPMISAMGNIIRKAQDSRNASMNEISRRIAKATDKLYKAGFKTDFMYEDEGHIISDIDWKKYYKERAKYKKNLVASGVEGLDLKMAIKDWEEENQEDRVVDNKSGRTERIPNKMYRKEFPNLTPEQQEYYDVIMQIKGEIGTLLPAYAQKQYLPPQVRRNTLDAIGEAKSLKDVGKAIKNKLKDSYVIREDDTNFGQILIDGELHNLAESDYDNTVKRQIPVFYINRIEKGELLKDFSSGLQHLAGSAINYDAMSSVADTVEFMGDYITDIPILDKNGLIDATTEKLNWVMRWMVDKSKKNNTSAIVRGFIDQHLYGIRRNDYDSKTISKVIDNLIKYTSFKGLATNIKGMVNNYLIGEFQMLVEAGCGEFYDFKAYCKAHAKLIGTAGVAGDMMELLTNNMRHKSTLMREYFDPFQDNFENKSGKRYYPGPFRQMLGHDCSFIGYASGEYIIHYVGMYAVLFDSRNNVKVNGKVTSLFDAFEVSEAEDGNAELRLKAGATKLDGSPIDQEFLDKVKGKIKYVNQSCHGAMDAEDKGLIHRRWMGRLTMNFRQWMVEHYSRRFRTSHWDASLGEWREGYWYTVAKAIKKGDAGDSWKNKHYAKAITYIMRDALMFTLRSQSQWDNLTEAQKYNIKRAHTEFIMFCLLSMLSAFVLGDPKDHKGDRWRRFWMYQVRRALMEIKSSMPHPFALNNMWQMLRSPFAGLNTLESMLYLLNVEDMGETIKSGPHKGWNKYWWRAGYNLVPGWKDYYQMKELDTSDNLLYFDNKPH